MTWRTERWKSLPQNRMQGEKRLKRKEDSPSAPWANIKHINIPVTGVPEGERKKGPEEVSEEVIAENSPKMEKEIVNQVQEVESPRQDKPKEEHTKTHSNPTGKP